MLLEYVRARGGEDAVRRVLERAQVPHALEELQDQGRWVSYDTRIRLFTAATEVLDDPGTMFAVGATALEHGLNHSLVLLLGALGSPRQIVRQMPRAVPKFSTTSSMEVLDCGATSATVRYRLHEGYQHSRLDCQYAQGLFAAVPKVFGLPPARIVHEECQSDGHPACVYHLTWSRRRLRPWRRSGPSAADAELAALRGQLQALQSAASELTSSDDAETVLQRITDRAAAAVLAPAYLLAVASPSGGAPLVHTAGLAPARARQLAEALLAGKDLGPGAVVVDVASPRRHHGRLAALYAPGHRPMVDERSMLGAYAGHAAAALDLLTALAHSRREESRASALLALAHEIAAAPDTDAVAAVAAAALPRIVGCTAASVMLWEPAQGLARTVACAGLGEEESRLLLATPVLAEETPELLGLLDRREPTTFTVDTASPGLDALCRAIAVDHVVAVPLVAGEAFLGVATASWATGEVPADLAGDVLVRLQGVADLAATALQKAQLLSTVRHQSLHDALTGLPNRVLFRERLEAALAAPVPGGTAVLFCDLDRFKDVNDRWGHAAGDELLRQVAARLRGVLRPGDTVGRLSGDEFALVLPDVADEAAAVLVAERVVSCLEEPFRLEGRTLVVTTSVGLAMCAEAGADGERVLRAADAAMYAAKQRGRNQVATSPTPVPRPAG